MEEEQEKEKEEEEESHRGEICKENRRRKLAGETEGSWGLKVGSTGDLQQSNVGPCGSRRSMCAG